MPKIFDPKDVAVSAVKAYQGPETPVGPATFVAEFLRGELYSVPYRDKDGAELRNYVYLHQGKPKILRSGEDVAREVGPLRPHSTLLGLLQIGGIAGVIAVMITAAICYMAVSGTVRSNVVDIPEVLKNALTMILGFYFGTQVSAAANREFGADGGRDRPRRD